MPDPFDPMDPSATVPVGDVRLPALFANRFAVPPPVQPVSIPGIPGVQIPAALVPVTPAPAPVVVKPVAVKPAPVVAKPVRPAAAKPAPPPTAMDLADAQMQQADQDRQAAVGEEKQAAQQTANVLSGQAQEEADAYHAANRQAEEMRARQALQMRQDLSDQKTMQAELKQAQDQFANSKIDPSRFWHDSSTGSKILMGIGLALGAAGQAFTRGQQNNAALDIIQGAIKQDVQLQMADREKLGTLVGQKGQALDRMMSITKDRQATYLSAVGAAYDAAKQQIAEIAAKTKDPLAQAQAKTLMGQLDADAAQAKNQAAQQAWTRGMDVRKQTEEERAHKVSEGIAYGHLALAKAANAEQIREYDLNRQDKLNEFALQKEQAGDAKLSAMAKDQRERGIFDPITGEPVLADPRGQTLLDQARNLDQQAAAQSDPKQAMAVKTQAEQLRMQASALYGATAPDKETAGPMRKQIGGVQSFINITDDLITKINQGPSAFSREEWANISQQYHDGVIALAKAMGEKLGPKAIEVMNEAMGEDPSGMWNRVANKGKIVERLEQAIRDQQTGMAAELKAESIRGELHFTRPSDAAKVEREKSGLTDYEAANKGKTAIEAGQAAEPGSAASWNPFSAEGPVARAGRYASKAVFGQDVVTHTGAAGAQDTPEQAEENAATGATGLSNEADAGVRRLIAKSAGGNKEALEKLTALAMSPRESLANGTLGLIKASSPAVYKAVLATLPEGRRGEVKTIDSAGAPSAASASGAVETVKNLARTGTPDQKKWAIQQLRKIAPDAAKELE